MLNRVYVGGTFDPIHLAHMQLAKCAAQAVNAGEVSFVLSAQPPHKQKQKQNGASIEQRLAMVKLAVEELNAAGEGVRYICDDRECRREGLSYTIDTVKQLRKQYPEDVLYWAIGMDSFNTLDSWHNWRELTEFVNLLVANRAEEPKQTSVAVQDWAASTGDKLRFIDMPPQAVSSTQIRKAKQNNQALQDLSPAVKHYIEKNRLYSSMTKLNDAITDALDDLKAQKVVHLPVAELTDVTDHLIICNGTSGRHVKSLAKHVVEELKPKGFKPIGVEGLEEGEWVLVDYGDTVVHVMQPQAREFYELEKLWSKIPAHREQAQKDG